MVWLIGRLRQSIGRLFVPVIRTLLGRDRWLVGVLGLPPLAAALVLVAGGLGYPAGWPFMIFAAVAYFAAILSSGRSNFGWK
jgi:hypothetical protein